jgi:quercetin 2,3-dioxygenase
MTESFVLRASDRGFIKVLSDGEASSYVAGHPDGVFTRHSSFNFREYQSGRPGFGQIRVFGEEIFSGQGCGYNIHRHHNFIICAFVLGGELTHINTVGKIDRLSRGEFYVFSAGSGGKHSELNLETEDLHVIYIWFLPDALLRRPSYVRGSFDRSANREKITTLIGKGEGALPIPQDVLVSRLASDSAKSYDYPITSRRHGVYAFVLEGEADCGIAKLGRSDSIGVWDTDKLSLRTGAAPTDLLLVETVM